MERFSNVLIGVDFSKPSALAIEHGLRVAEWNGATTRVFHVSGEPQHALVASDTADAQLDGFLKEARVDSSVPREVLVGSPLDESLGQVQRNGTDLFVIGAYGPLGELTGNGVGAFATQCMRHLPCDVLVVHPNARESFSRIVVATDFSAPATKALESAIRLCRQEEGELHLIHVPEAAGEDGAEQRLHDALAVAEGVDLDHRIVVTKPGHTARQIIRYVRDIDADLIALGSQGITNLRYALMGRTCESVLRAVRRSVLLAKAEDFVPISER